MLNKDQFKDLIRRILKEAELPRKDAAVDLLLGTAAQESGFGHFIRQVSGPALGVFQMEPETFKAVQRFAATNKDLAFNLSIAYLTHASAEELEWDLKLQILAARVNYLRFPGSIPEDLSGQAGYWKKHWNTSLGRGTVEQYVRNFQKYVA